MGRCFSLLALSLVLLVAPSQAGEPLTLNIIPKTLHCRSGGPLLVDAVLDWQGSGMLAGRLALAMPLEDGVKTEVVSDEITLVRGKRRLSLVFPALHGLGYSTDNQIRIVGRFHTQGVAIPLDYQLVSLPHRVQLWRSIGVISPVELRTPELDPLITALRLESVLPPTLKAGGKEEGHFNLQTVVARLSPEEAAIHSLGLCAFDLVLISERAFPVLKDWQLENLSSWILGGGTAFIMCRGILQDSQVEFLNRLAAMDGVGRAVYTLDSESRLNSNGSDSPFTTLRPGLGRVVLAGARYNEHVTTHSPDWMGVVAHLWRIRHEQVPSLINNGVVDEVLRLKRFDQFWKKDDNRFYRRGEDRDSARQQAAIMPMLEGESLLKKLMPTTIRPIPLALVISLLLVFTLLVGPGDYLLLGRLKRRKFTWILFPLLSILFALGMVQIADHYMGREDHRRYINFYDLGRDDSIIKETRFELLLSATSVDRKVEVQHQLLAPVPTAELWNQYAYSRHRSSREQRATVFTGRYPRRYSSVIRLEQWTPNLTRYTGFVSGLTVPPVQWDNINPVDLLDPEARQRLKRQWQAQIPGICSAVVLHQDKTFCMVHDADAPAKALLNSSVKRQGDGIFSLVSQISPDGAPTMADMAFFDDSDPQALALMITTRHDNGFKVYRRSYRLK